MLQPDKNSGILSRYRNSIQRRNSNVKDFVYLKITKPELHHRLGTSRPSINNEDGHLKLDENPRLKFDLNTFYRNELSKLRIRIVKGNPTFKYMDNIINSYKIFIANRVDDYSSYNDSTFPVGTVEKVGLLVRALHISGKPIKYAALKFPRVSNSIASMHKHPKFTKLAIIFVNVLIFAITLFIIIMFPPAIPVGLAILMGVGLASIGVTAVATEACSDLVMDGLLEVIEERENLDITRSSENVRKKVQSSDDKTVLPPINGGKPEAPNKGEIANNNPNYN